jgi:mRNA interferase MazF
VLAITSRCQKKKYMPTHIPIESSDLSMSSIALAEQVRTVDKTRLTRYVGRASKESMEAVDQALKVSMGVS